MQYNRIVVSSMNQPFGVPLFEIPNSSDRRSINLGTEQMKPVFVHKQFYDIEFECGQTGHREYRTTLTENSGDCKQKSNESNSLQILSCRMIHAAVVPPFLWSKDSPWSGQLGASS